MKNPLADDLNFIVEATRDTWESLRGQRLFLTGGTGFFGCWLLESFLWANEHLELGASAVVLTRNPEAFAVKAPHLATAPSVALLTGDVRSFDYPPGEFTYVIHAANDPNPVLAREDPLAVLDTIVQGTRHTLEFARQCGARDCLLTSSGAVYGTQPPELSHVPEDYTGAPDPTSPRSIYGEGKRLVEMLCTLYNVQHGINVKIARCFAFVGPYLPLGANFAVGNFIRDALHGGPIQVQGDGRPYRSYLYAADLAVWLWTILEHGQPCHPYNVGADDAISVKEVAHLVAEQFDPVPPVEIALKAIPGTPAPRYVPSNARAREELGLLPTENLKAAIGKTVEWHTRREGTLSP